MLRMPGTMRFCALFLLPLVFTIATHGQSPPPADGPDEATGQLPPKFVQMIKSQVSWDSGFDNPSGPRLRFLKLDELIRPDGHFTRYRVYAEGVPEGTPFVFAVWKIGTDLQNLQVLSSTAYVNHKGLLLTNTPTQGEEDSDTVGDGTEFDLGVQAANGEPIRFVLRSKDNKVLVPGTLVPYPIESIDHGCRLTALLSVPEGQAILIYGDGLPPNSEVVINGDSAGELKESKHAVDAAGRLQVFEMPFVLGKESGTLKETITAKGCKVSVSIPWGKGSYQKH